MAVNSHANDPAAVQGDARVFTSSSLAPSDDEPARAIADRSMIREV